MPVTVHDIARQLNLSSMTVSRALSQRDGRLVAPATRARVEQAAQEMGYRPNASARALATGRTHIIGLWISHLRSSVYSRIAEALRAEVQGAGLEVSVCEMDWHFPGPRSRRFQWPVDGILAVDPPEPHALAQLLPNLPPHSTPRGTPRVHLGSGQSVPWEGDSVRVDLGAGTRCATQHLLSVGCRRVAYVVPAGLDRAGQSHHDAYSAVVRAAGQRPECIPCPWQGPGARAAVRDYVQQHGHPDGIFCHHDELTIAAFRALRDLGLRVPDDVALIGCEGNEFLEYFDPPLATIALPIEEMCRQAWRLLQARIEDPSRSPHAIELPFQFLQRESSRQTSRNNAQSPPDRH